MPKIKTMKYIFQKISVIYQFKNRMKILEKLKY
jgi:hypothetical protein